MDETLKSALVDAVLTAVQSVRPDVHKGSKYGDTVFVTNPDAPETIGLVGGVFKYKEHISVEFSRGADFRDPEGLLEGKGKTRRHVKLRALSDLDEKNVTGFLKQALA